MTDAYTTAAATLAAANDILITTHLNPDGDGIGSGLALLLALEAMGKRVRFLCPSPVATMYGFLPGFARITVCEDEAVAKAMGRADVAISCDAGDIQRLGAVWQVPRTTFINLDHHATNTRFGDLNLVDEAAASSGVVVKGLLDHMGVPLTQPIAENLYTTIVFDTGRFMHSNTTAAVFRVAARLLDTGIDAAAINRRLTYTRTIKDLRLQKLAIEHLVADEAEPRLAGIALTQAAVTAAGGEPEDWGDLVEVPRSLRGNEIAYLVRERTGKDGAPVCKLSLRANPPFVVGTVAQHFGGGGHLQAAGATVPGTLTTVMAELLPLLRAACA
jgi:phosphoesterase RecJ-like protein